MAAVSLFGNTNVAAVTCENREYVNKGRLEHEETTLRDSGNFVKTPNIRVKLIPSCPQAHAISIGNRMNSLAHFVMDPSKVFDRHLGWGGKTAKFTVNVWNFGLL